MSKGIDHKEEVYHNTGLHISSRTIDLSGEIDYALSGQFIRNLHILEHLSNQAITVKLNTPGGDETQGMAIYDVISLSKCEITIFGIGDVCSMGSIIFQAGNRRLLYPNAILMFHLGDSDDGIRHKKANKNWHEFAEKYDKKLADILYTRILEKHPNFLRRKFDRMNEFDTILTAKEAVDLGLADGIVRWD